MKTTDQSIDQLLQALGTAAVPSGLEQRVNARLAQHSVYQKNAPSLVSRIFKSTWTVSFSYLQIRPATVLTTGIVVFGAGCLFQFAHVRTQTAASGKVPTLLSKPFMPKSPPNTQAISHKFAASSPPSVNLSELQRPSPTSNDFDAIALAETIAPSHPAPPLPLTMQETLLLHSTRPGQPLEIAELDILRESAVNAIAAAHERANVREYIHGLLGPLATAQALTPSNPQPDDGKSISDIEPPSSK
jgi:hypothetical protein